MQQAPTNNTQMRTAAIVTIVVIIGLLLLGRFVTGMMNNDNTPTTTDTIDNTNNNNGDLVPNNNTTNNTNTNLNDLGPVVAAQNIDRDGCAVDATTSFDRNDDVYIVLADSALPRNTSMFARLYKDNVAIEDTDELVTQDDYNNVCVNFVFEPTDRAEVWEDGNYEVEFYVNGNAYQSTSFQIR